MEKLIKTTRRNGVTFNPDGELVITAEVVRGLGLKEGDVINVASQGMEYYLFRHLPAEEAQGRHQGRLRYVKRGSLSLKTNSKTLFTALFGDRKTQARCPVGPVEEIEGIGKAVSIITRGV